MDPIELLIFKMIMESFNSCIGKEIALPIKKGKKVVVIKQGIPFKRNQILEMFCDAMNTHTKGGTWDARELHRIIEAWHTDTLNNEDRIRIRTIVDKVSRRTNQLNF